MPRLTDEQITNRIMAAMKPVSNKATSNMQDILQRIQDIRKTKKAVK